MMWITCAVNGSKPIFSLLCYTWGIYRYFNITRGDPDFNRIPSFLVRGDPHKLMRIGDQIDGADRIEPLVRL